METYEGGLESAWKMAIAQVDMPPGMFTGQTIRLREQGVAGETYS